MRFFCRTCPYIYQVKSKVRNEAVLQRKVQDDVLGGPDDWKNAEETDGAHAPRHSPTPCTPCMYMY